MSSLTVPPEWADAVEAWSDHAALRGSPLTTIRTRREHVQRCGRTIGVESPWCVDAHQLATWFHRQPWARETRRCHRTTLRGFYRWGCDLGHVEDSPALAIAPIRPGPPNPKPLPDQPLRLALAAADQRERLMLLLAAELGMRRAEVAQVRPDRDLVEDLVGWSLVVHGKGDKDRVLPMPGDLAAELRAAGPGWLFPGEDGGHLSPRWVGTLVGRLLPEPWTMHALRHRFATRVWDTSGGDLFVVQELLGHASPVTTKLYVKVPNERLRAAVEAAAA